MMVFTYLSLWRQIAYSEALQGVQNSQRYAMICVGDAHCVVFVFVLCGICSVTLRALIAEISTMQF